MTHLLSMGGIVVEVMRPEPDLPLGETHPFVGPFPSGAACITVSAAARLGWRCAFVGTVGDDDFGQVILRRFREDGVNVSGIARDPDRTTGVAFVAYRSDGSRRFIYHCRDAAAGAVSTSQFRFEEWGPIDWVHIGGSTLALDPEWRHACDFAARAVVDSGGKLSFDPNLRIELMDLDHARGLCFPYIRRSSMFAPSESEITALFQKDVHASIDKALEMGCQLVAVKRGEKGCIIASTRNRCEIPGFSVRCKDPTGAGDTFDAAAMFALSLGLDNEGIGTFANAVAAMSTLKLGPMEGCPTREEVREFLTSRGRTDIWDKISQH